MKDEIIGNAYVEEKLRGLMASETFADMDEARTWAWEQAQQGLTVSLWCPRTGHQTIITPDNAEEALCA